MSKNNDNQDLTQVQEIKLAVLREQSKFVNRLDKQMTKIMNAEIEIEDFNDYIFRVKEILEEKLEDYKCELDLHDDEWENEEVFDMEILFDED